MKKDLEEFKKSRKKAKEVVLAEEEEYDSDGDAFLVQEEVEKSNDSWILDSACSFHVCADKQLFSSYKSCSHEESVVLADNHELKIHGVGSVKIKMHDGLVRTFRDVRHVPKLGRNLISLGRLDSKGYGYSAQGGVLKIMKGTLVVMKGELRAKNLYRLAGNAVKSRIQVEACNTSKKQFVDATNKRKVGFAMMASRKEDCSTRKVDGRTHGGDSHTQAGRRFKQIWVKKCEAARFVAKSN